MTDPWIDPIVIREQLRPERPSLRAFFSGLTASCSHVPKSEMLEGADVSQWQGVMDWDKFFSKNEYAVIRAMINGYPDEQYERNVNILTNQNRKFLCYGATGYPTLSNAIPYARAFAELVQGVPYLALWWDSELSGLLNPQEMAIYNSELLSELSVLLPGTKLEIYTRQSFWDSSVAAGNWSKYPLAAARYNTYLTCPWSDNRFVFRDWDDWRYWQDSQWYSGDDYGAESTYIDHLYFNGNSDDFDLTYSVDAPPPVEECAWKFRVMRESLNYRSAPVVRQDTWRGSFEYGDVISAINIVNPQLGDFWLKFESDDTYYAALTYQGRQYCEPLEY